MTTDELKQEEKTMRTIQLGQVVMTSGVRDSVPATELMRALARHSRCDWGDVLKDDWQANNDALKYGDRVLSSYKSDRGETFWIITEWDRSATTILLPNEY